jgi:hypothetical protein
MSKTKKNTKLPKDEVINVRLTAEQKVQLEAVATSQGMGLSTWLLHLGLADVERRAERRDAARR